VYPSFVLRRVVIPILWDFILNPELAVICSSHVVMFLVCLVSHNAYVSRNSARLHVKNSINYLMLYVFTWVEISFKLDITDLSMFFWLVLPRPTAEEQVCIFAVWLCLICIHMLEVINMHMCLGWIRIERLDVDAYREWVVGLTPLEEYVGVDQAYDGSPHKLAHPNVMFLGITVAYRHRAVYSGLVSNHIRWLMTHNVQRAVGPHHN